MIKIFNPRYLLRQGSSDMMHAVTDGHIVLFRCGEIAPCGEPVVRCATHGTAGKPFDGVRKKVYRLIELTPQEIEKYEKVLAKQNKNTVRMTAAEWEAANKKTTK